MAKRVGAKKALRAYFIEHVGEVIQGDVLREVANGQSEWARRIRELRNQEGMNIATHNDLSDLTPGQYMLVDLKPLPAFDRSISKETRAFVLDRNGFTCQMCGIAAGESHPDDGGRKARLHIGHIVDKQQGGDDEPSNLRALCSVCNEGAANTTLERPPARKLLAQIRRAAGKDQMRILEWLIGKYPKEAAKIVDG
jgi:hypothetical protein